MRKFGSCVFNYEKGSYTLTSGPLSPISAEGESGLQCQPYPNIKWGPLTLACPREVFDL